MSSRRAAEDLITSGRVRVNGRVVSELGAKADPRADRIEVDGKRLVAEALRYIVLHKPRGVVSTLSDPEGRPTVGEILRSVGARVFPIGRLDFATSGVLLATNDGGFSQALLHPRGGVPKTYVLKVRGRMEEADIDRWRDGVDLDDGKTLPAEASLLRYEDDKTWLEITLREGRNQQIRRMGEATGFPVMRLARTIFAGITHEGLRPGEYRDLTMQELLDLRKRFGVKASPVRGGAARAPAAGADKPSPHGDKREGGPRRERPRRDDGRPARPQRPGGEAAPKRRTEGAPPKASHPRGGEERRPHSNDERRPRSSEERRPRSGERPFRAPGGRPR